MIVVIGSKNPTKLEAVKQAFVVMLPNTKIEFIGVETDSGVAEQPMNDEEALKGATNRARNALKMQKADFGVGIEGGQSNVGGKWFTGTATVVITKDGRLGFGFSPRVQTPKIISKQIDDKNNLSDAVAKSHGIADIGKKQGLSGLVTSGAITRVTSSRDAVIAAIGILLHEQN